MTNLNKLIEQVKVNENQDMDSIHDLKTINQLNVAISTLSDNYNRYIQNFLNSKLLTKEQLFEIVPDHKIDEMLLNGLTVCGHKLNDKSDIRNYIDKRHDVYTFRNACSNSYKFDRFVISTIFNAIIPIPDINNVGYSEYRIENNKLKIDIKHYNFSRFNRQPSHRTNYNLFFDITNNELCEIIYEKEPIESYHDYVHLYELSYDTYLDTKQKI